MKTDTKLNFDAILKAVAIAPSEARIAPVTEERLADRACQMARRGYVHSPESLFALQKYLEGFGLFLIGNCGTGKTLFFRTINAIVKASGGGGLVILPMIDFVGRRVSELRDVFVEHERDEMVLDDVGSEPTFNEFGNRWDILPWLLEMRMYAPARTHFTTNLSREELVARYGVRTIDRLHEVAVSVDMGGKSMRRTVPNARAVKIYKETAKAATETKTQTPNER